MNNLVVLGLVGPFFITLGLAAGVIPPALYGGIPDDHSRSGPRPTMQNDARPMSSGDYRPSGNDRGSRRG